MHINDTDLEKQIGDCHSRLTEIVDTHLGGRPTASIAQLLAALEKELPVKLKKVTSEEAYVKATAFVMNEVTKIFPVESIGMERGLQLIHALSALLWNEDGDPDCVELSAPHSGAGGGDDVGYMHPDVLATQTLEMQAEYSYQCRKCLNRMRSAPDEWQCTCGGLVVDLNNPTDEHRGDAPYEPFPWRVCKSCGAKTKSTSTIDYCSRCHDSNGLRPRHFLTRDKTEVPSVIRLNEARADDDDREQVGEWVLRRSTTWGGQWRVLGPLRETKEAARADLPAPRADYVLAAAEEEIDRRNIGHEIPAPVALSSGEVCFVVRRVVDNASPRSLPGALAAMNAIYDLVTRRGARPDSSKT